MEPIEIVAMTLGTIAAASFFLQAFKIEKLRESKEIALPMYVILLVTAITWLLYGISIGSLPLIVSYTVGVVSNATVIVVYFMHDKSRK